MNARQLKADERRAWQAVRLRIAQQNPALGAALYRATPVAVDGLVAESSADRWGRVYVDFSLEQSKSIGSLADVAERAFASWLQDGGSEESYHVDLFDEEFPAVEQGERETLAVLTATRMQSMPRPKREPWESDNEDDLWREWSERMTGRTAVPWQRVLAGFVRSALAYEAGAVDYTYSRPSRRSLPGVVLPAMRHPRMALAVVCDVSPSVGFALDLIGAEVHTVARSAGVDPANLWVIPTDDTVRDVLRYRPGLELPAPGGRTDMGVGIEAALRLRPRPDAIIVITDGITPWPAERPAVPVIVALVRPNDVQLELAAKDVPSWASLVRIELKRSTVTV